MIRTKDARRSARQPVHARVSVTWDDGQGHAVTTRGRVRDLSGAGMGIDVMDPIPRGSLVSLRVQPMGWNRGGLVRHCTRTGARYLVGIEASEFTWFRYS